MRHYIPGAILLALQLVGCKDAAAPVSSAAISVSVKVAGVYPSDRFQIQVDGRSMTFPVTAGNLVVRGLTAGPHTVSLVDLPAACRIEGSNPATVNTSTADLSGIEFSVSCVASAGAIAVQVSVSGYTKQLFFRTLLDGVPLTSLARGNATTVLPGPYAGGTHVVTLIDIPTFCEPPGEISTPVTVRTGAILQDTALASFSISCVEPEPIADTAAKIVFERAGEILVMRESGGTPVPLTQGQRPVWSPSGNAIAFQRSSCSEELCEHDLWLRSATADDERAVLQNPDFDDYDPAFSPNGDRLAYIRIWLGPDQSYLTVSDLHGGSVGILSIWNPLGSPSWSPDGARIAFACSADISARSVDLCIVNTASPCLSYFPAGCNLTLQVLTNGQGDVEHPRWSPDGRRIAFTVGCTDLCTSLPPASQRHIAVIDVATRSVTELVPGYDPSWSPDGSKLVFAGPSSSPGLRIYRFADGSVVSLTDNSADRWPSWRE